MFCEAEDAGGLSPGKDDNEVRRKIDRKDVLVLEWFDYNFERIEYHGNTR